MPVDPHDPIEWPRSNLVNEVERLRKIEAAAEEVVDINTSGHDPTTNAEYLYDPLEALEKTLGGKPGPMGFPVEERDE